MRKTTLITMLAVLLTTALVVPAHATVVRNLTTGQGLLVANYDTDAFAFNPNTDDADPTASAGSFTVDEGNPQTIQVTTLGNPKAGTPAAFDGPNSVVVRRKPDPPSNLNGILSATPGVGDALHIELAVYATEASNQTFAKNGFFALEDAGGNPAGVQVVGSNAWAPVGVAVQTGGWTQFFIDYVVGNANYNMTIIQPDGTVFAGLNPGSTGSGTIPLRFRMSTDSNDLGTYYDAIPEPASLTLLGLGGLALLRRNRKMG